MLNLFAESTASANIKSKRNTSALIIIKNELEVNVVIIKSYQNRIKRWSFCPKLIFKTQERFLAPKKFANEFEISTDYATPAINYRPQKKISSWIALDTKFGNKTRFFKIIFLLSEGSLFGVINSFCKTSRAQKNVFEISSWRLCEVVM